MPRRRHPTRPRRRPSAAPVVRATPPPTDVQQVAQTREMFWNNVMREILTALSVISGAGGRRDQRTNEPPAEGEESHEPSLADPLDGRLAVVTSLGERIPIADVYPLFACGIPGSHSERALSIAVECTVFQIRTPAGEVYTLPLHEIRGFHAISESLMRELTEAAQAGRNGGSEPFGFAAFTSLARSDNGDRPGESGDLLGPGI